MSKSKQKKLSRLCPECGIKIKYRSQLGYDGAIKNKSSCVKCKSVGPRNTKTNDLEVSGALVCDTSGWWHFTCPTCKRNMSSKYKGNVLICRRCNPQKPSVTKKVGVYWPESLDEVIDKFNKSENREEVNKIYEEQLKYPFEKLVENIFNTFKFSYFEVGPLEIQKETISHLISQINKYDMSKGFKSFSYFSIIAKNYLIALNNSTYKKFNIHETLDFDPNTEEGRRVEHKLIKYDNHYEKKDRSEFMELMLNFWDTNVNKIFHKKNDLNIAYAVIELFRSRDRIDFYNKKALYLMIREISSCKTQQITKILSKMREYQDKIQREWNDTGYVDVNLFGKEMSIR
jgi:hypothetical protein